MKIYRVSVQDEMMRWYHFATKREADAFAASERRRQKDDGFESGDIAVEAESVAPTRAGIAAAFNDFVELTCMNEG